MALSDLGTYKDFAGIPLSDTSQDVQLGNIIPAACQVVLSYCKRHLETAAYTEYLSGNNTPKITVREYPVVNQVLSGTLASGSAVVTGLSSTSTLLAGMTVSGTGVPGPSLTSSASPTVILSVDSLSQVTLSANATATGSKSLTFGIGLYLDPQGYFGKALGAFNLTSTLQTEGLSYVPEYAPDGTCRSGNLIRLGGGILPSAFAAADLFQFRQGTLTARLPPVWPAGYGNIKVIMSAGLGVGPKYSGGTLPDDITLATNQVASFILANYKNGIGLQSETMGQHSWAALGRLGLGQSPELGETREILSHYRKISI